MEATVRIALLANLLEMKRADISSEMPAAAMKTEKSVISKKAHHVFENNRCFACILFWGERMHMSEFQQIFSYKISYLHITILSFTLLSLFLFLHRVI